MPKYGNKKCTWGGEVFDSKKERDRWITLCGFAKMGKISNLERQVHYVLIPTMREPETVGKRGGVKVGKVIERSCEYVADFSYKDEDGKTVVEDVKSRATRTPQYVIKRKLMLWRYGIIVKEV